VERLGGLLFSYFKQKLLDMEAVPMTYWIAQVLTPYVDVIPANFLDTGGWTAAFRLRSKQPERL